MYLKSIKAYGFKSFADKTDITLTKGISGIVGPNGSGKSNIVDAVKWVLGEQSVKALRADTSMTGVIFTGSKSRDALSRASVSLTFDNSDNYLNTQFDEVEIKRVLYKTGENEYYINNVRSRLKDISDLFIDTGAGKESFNIISQGKIEDIINSKPEDRRSIFEEAAGVLKYKKRKEESLRKLDKTKDNLDKISLIINELELQVLPLKEQSEIAKKYQGFINELKSIEVALVASDITELNKNHELFQNEINNINKEIEELDLFNNADNTKVDELKLKNIKIDEKISFLNESILKVSDELSILQSEKQITLERQKYEVEDIKLQNNLTFLKEKEQSNKKVLSGLSKDIDDYNTSLSEVNEKREVLIKDTDILTSKRDILKNSIDKNKEKELYLQNKINIIENNLLNDNSIPYSVKAILNNPRLDGIHNILGKLIDTSMEYSLAIDTSLGYMSNVIIVDNELSSKKAITYLKDNKLGRATFFPLNIIKPKGIDDSLLERLKSINGFVDIASNLVEFDPMYRNIITNQLGNVIVARNLYSANIIGKIIDFKYRIVTIDGELLHTGGSITGGSIKNNASIISQKNELEHINNDLSILKENIQNDQIKLNSINDEINISMNNLNSIQNNIISLNEMISIKETNKNEISNELNNISNEIKGTLGVQGNSLVKDLDKILDKVTKKEIEKDNLIKDLNNFKKEKDNLNDEINNLDHQYKEFNKEYNIKQNKLKELEINVSKIDVKLDNLLVLLNENYNLTYERAKEEYILSLDEKEARTKVNSLKFEIKNLNDVNIGSIAEYERVNKRYTFLTDQKNDLENSINNLMSIIDEMDNIMVDKFRDTFNLIKKEFEIVFNKLFKGGKGILKLTDPDNILSTGIDIIAEPPGKKLNSIALLSGGEKTLTAISLLFSILNVKPVPFVILDEVEAALDEANVDMFGKYLLDHKNNSQYIIITHKKRTMEYADVLYGITMQESGVSKLVSVKLDNI